ncbi:MAG: TIGR00341 family protein [Candidatus Competibacteraceae bacterium]|nr:TIGR00341 family protein [Candidatus Competibacteraceae bacterium]
MESISKLSIDFLVLLSGSTVIATLGLFQNSPAVIIGAMIIAPLMRPLVGLSLATLTADTRLLIRSLMTLLVGTIVGAALATVIAIFLRSLELTPEILGRTHPTLLDLGVAVFAGAVGAYCQANEKLADTLAGVAIAVALVPPLSVVGIGLAFNSIPVWSGAALLYATNLIGITVAGSLVFLLRGYVPLKHAKKDWQSRRLLRHCLSFRLLSVCASLFWRISLVAPSEMP